LGNCQAEGRPSLYHCNRWDCQYCLAKKIYWLREQAVVFARELEFVQVWFLTFKGFENAPQADDFIKYLIQCEKLRKSPHNAKFEYFYVIANHGFNHWHIHLLTNRELHGHSAYCKPVESLRASSLYLVGNLLRSARAEYGRVRRYGASRILYKQNMKKRFIARRKTYWLIVHMALVKRLINRRLSEIPLPYHVDLGYALKSQPQRYNRVFISELTFRRARDDLIGE